jgi:hypothetical protein
VTEKPGYRGTYEAVMPALNEVNKKAKEIVAGSDGVATTWGEAAAVATEKGETWLGEKGKELLGKTRSAICTVPYGIQHEDYKKGTSGLAFDEEHYEKGVVFWSKLSEVKKMNNRSYYSVRLPDRRYAIVPAADADKCQP